MKNVEILLICLFQVLLTYAQNKTESTKADSLHTIMVARGCTNLYYIDGIRVSNNRDFRGIQCYSVLPPVRIEGTTTIEYKQLERLPQRNINAIAGTVAGVDSRAGQTPNIRGARQDGTAYYVDGVRIRELEIP